MSIICMQRTQMFLYLPFFPPPHNIDAHKMCSLTWHCWLLASLLSF